MRRFTAESFGEIIPTNWEEICDVLNSFAEAAIREEDDEDIQREILNVIWEKYSSGKLAGIVPEEQYEKETVLDENGDPVNYEAAVILMDDDLREKLQMKLSPCSRQEFFDEYAKAHQEKYNEGFAPAVGGEW
jgi:hypothetical protein